MDFIIKILRNMAEPLQSTALDKLFISNKVCLKGDHEMLLIEHK